jgi:hypothetical protein
MPLHKKNGRMGLVVILFWPTIFLKVRNLFPDLSVARSRRSLLQKLTVVMRNVLHDDSQGLPRSSNIQ